MFISTETLYLDKQGNVVKEGDQNASQLLVAKGGGLEDWAVERYDLGGYADEEAGENARMSVTRSAADLFHVTPMAAEEGQPPEAGNVGGVKAGVSRRSTGGDAGGGDVSEVQVAPADREVAVKPAAVQTRKTKSPTAAAKSDAKAKAAPGGKAKATK